MDTPSHDGFLGVLALDDASIQRAESLAQEFSLPIAGPISPIVKGQDIAWPQQIVLGVSADGLDLRALDAPKLAPLKLDFAAGALDFRRKHGGGQLIAKAIGDAKRVLDLTCGLARDAFALAGLGIEVLGIERCAPIFALTRDGLERARTSSDQSLLDVLARLRIAQDDSQPSLRLWVEEFQPHAVLIDPMYPHQRGSALPGKEMRLLRPLAGDDEDAADLPRLALASGVHRVVVKRPRKAEPLGELTPHHSHEGKSTRFDVYIAR